MAAWFYTAINLIIHDYLLNVEWEFKKNCEIFVTGQGAAKDKGMEKENDGMKTGIIFDMDGTLWDSAQQVAEAWSSVTRQKLGKGVTEADMRRVMGMPMDRLVKTLFPEHGPDELLPVMETCCRVENDYLRIHGAELYPDVGETLKALCARYPLYIVSNCQTGYIEAFLAHYGFGAYFRDFICFGANGKQKSENIAMMVRKHELDRAFYVGDIQADYEAAVAGGAEFIHAAYGFGAVDAQTPRIDTFSQILAMVDDLC